MNCVICAIAKQENQYIYEWAKHHLQIGFSHIHIYDNNEIDGERIVDVFKETDIEGNITIHDVRGMKCMQLKVYQECYDEEDFEWCAFVDIDEFITFTSQQMTISEFLKNKVNFEAVHLNWLCYGDDEQLESDGRGVVERLAHSILPIDFKAQYIMIPENAHIKSIIRKGLDIRWDAPGDIIDYATPHTPANLNLVCNELGYQVANIPWNTMSHNVCYIAHYITKTISEYGMKTQRKAADSNCYTHSFSRFFRYNKFSLRKLYLMKQVTSTAKVFPIIYDKFKWWNFTNHTYLSSFYRKYRRMMERDKLIIKHLD